VETSSTDYLIVGAGALGMIFADQMLSESDADMVIVDRRAAPGGHWIDAYPFVRLHLPSAYYGAGSRDLGTGRIDEAGHNAGLYELASLPEILAHFDRLMRERFLPSGRVRYFPRSEYLGEGRIRSLVSGEESQVTYRKIVDTSYFDIRIPSTHTPSFSAEEGVAVIPPNALPERAKDFRRFVLLGASKTAMDAGTWLLQAGVDPSAIRWVRPRDSWLINRATIQPGARFQMAFSANQAATLEAAAAASDIDDLFLLLEAAGVLMRIDRSVTPTMFRGATLSQGEAELLATITDIVRLGHVTHIAPDRLTLDQGVVAANPDALYIDCTAMAFARRPAIPVFDGERITPQTLRGGVVCLSAALIAHVEAAYEGEALKNHLCTPVTLGEDREDWLRWTLADIAAGARWAEDADLRKWIGSHRLSGFRAGEARPETTDETRAISDRIRIARPAAVANLRRLLGAAG